MQLVYHGYLNDTGYSIAAQDYILSMKRTEPSLNIKFKPFNKQIDLGVSKKRQDVFSPMIRKITEKHHINLYHCIPHRYKKYEYAKKNIGFCIFETINPPQDWINSMNNMDSIITASTFNESVFKTNGVNVEINKVPHCFDPEMFNKDVHHNGRYSLFTFVAIGTWKQRKNWENLIKAFYDAFEESDDVCLLIKTDRQQEMVSTVARIKKTQWRTKRTSPIFSESYTRCNFENMPSIIKKGDVYINPSLGEGFGYSGLHAMACGIPVLTVRFGGALEYAKSEYVTYIEPEKYQLMPSLDNIPQYRNTIWPVVTHNSIKDKLIYVKKNYNECIQKSRLAYNFVHKNLTYQAIGSRLLESIFGAKL